jgi:3-hydroxyacyl-[acyl-carrier-protein] dehydratase
MEHDLHDLIPHRHPILLVDRVLSWRPPDELVAVKAVTRAEPCFADAPATAAYPPTLLLESFTQACAVLWQLGARADGTGLTGVLFFGAARDVVFHRPVYPGALVRHEVRLDQRHGDNAFLSGQSTVDGTPVMTVGSVITAVR